LLICIQLHHLIVNQPSNQPKQRIHNQIKIHKEWINKQQIWIFLINSNKHLLNFSNSNSSRCIFFNNKQQQVWLGIQVWMVFYFNNKCNRNCNNRCSNKWYRWLQLSNNNKLKKINKVRINIKHNLIIAIKQTNTELGKIKIMRIIQRQVRWNQKVRQVRKKKKNKEKNNFITNYSIFFISKNKM
jgi:hypothetical protein